MLKKLFGSRSDEDLVVCLSRPVADIRRQAGLLCLSKDKAFLSQGPQGERQSMPGRAPAQPDGEAIEELARTAGSDLQGGHNMLTQFQLG